MKQILAVLAATLGFLVSAGYAAAEPQGAAQQALGQAALSGQAGAALSGASQTQPTDTNVSVRILSPGDNGDVKQSNSASSSATAANANVTDQSADQKQGGGCGCPGGTQAVGQEAKSDQAAGAVSVASQSGATNTNIPVRILSPGDNGSVSQSNKVDSDATAANLNATKQDADQSGGAGGTQAIGQDASSSQQAGAISTATQDGAANTNISVRILSPGDDGHVSQSNSVDSGAKAVNANVTKQDADQDQGGHSTSCGCSSGGVQAIGQSAQSDQQAGALSVAKQAGASNTNVPVRVLSPGDNGSVSQSNSVDSDATAANLNLTGQDAEQDGGGSGIQAVGQEAKSDQTAIALSGAFQIGASNTNTPVRVGSKGDDGHVSQSNSVDSDATAANLNATKQDADQDQGGSGIQAIGQEAKSDQTAVGLSGAVQLGASNTNTPVAVGGSSHDGCGCEAAKDGKGHGGDVDQSNRVDSDATAANLNLTSQDADQDQGGTTCGCHGSDGIQAIGQSAQNEQGALAGSLAVQAAGCGCSPGGNSNAPVSVDSRSHGGDVDQSNRVDSDATAVNANATKQDADQDQGGSNCSCHGSDGIQAIGQESKSRQKAIALSAAFQLGASNSNTPVAVGGSGHDKCGCEPKAAHDRKSHGGDVDQSNRVDSDATAANLNATGQHADQDGGSGIQAIGQSAHNAQFGLGLSLALQLGATNAAGRAVN